MTALTEVSQGASVSRGVVGEKGRIGIEAIGGGDNGLSSNVISSALPDNAASSVSVEESDVESKLLTGLSRSMVEGIGESGSPLSLPESLVFLALRLTAMGCLLVGRWIGISCCFFLARTALLASGETLTALR